MTGILLGKETRSQEWVRVAHDAMNGHILITGTSGSGKTVAEKYIERGAIKDGGSVIVLNYNQTHMDMEGDHIETIHVCQDGFPMSLIAPSGNEEWNQVNRVKIAQNVIKVLEGIDKLSVRQRTVIRSSILEMGIQYPVSDEFLEIGEKITVIGKRNKRLEDAAEAVLDKYFELFHLVRIRVREVVIPGKIVVIDLSGYDLRTQKILAELSISILWRDAARKGGHSPFPTYLVLDEFQVLDCRKGYTIEEILREGRKFGLHLVMATQTLSMFPKEIQPVLEIPATKLYFPMVEKERRKLAGQLPYPKAKSEKVLSGLERGTCLATGTFEIKGYPCRRPILLTFRNLEC